MRYSSVASRISIGLCLLALVGCAGNPTSSDRMREHAAEDQVEVDLKKQIANKLEKGEKLVATGEKRVKEGEKRVREAERNLKKGQEEIERGRREIAEGQKLIEESKEKWRQNYPELKIYPR